MTSPADSLWLQKSITLADPLPNVSGMSPPRAVTTDATEPNAATAAHTETPPVPAVPTPVVAPASDTPSSCAPPAPTVVEGCATPLAQGRGGGAGEMDLTKMVLDTSLFASAQRPSSFRHSMRASVANAGGVSALEFDELRARYSQAKRELLRVGDVQKDLDFARFELTRCKEELKMTQTSYDQLRATVEEVNVRLETERRARADAEQRVTSEAASHSRDTDFLKCQIEDLRQQNSRRQQELSEEQEQTYQRRIDNLREELSAVQAAHEEIEQVLAATEAQRDQAMRQHQDALAHLQTTRTDLVESKARIEAVRAEMESESARFASKLAAAQQQLADELAAQKSLHEARLQELTDAKTRLKSDNEAEVRDLQDAARQLRDELAATRQRCAELEHDAQATCADRDRQISRLIEEHRLALSGKELEMEAAICEARSSKVSINEDNSTLRRKVSQLSEQLSTVSAVLAQREQEREGLLHQLAELKVAVTHSEAEKAGLRAEADGYAADLDGVQERLARLQQERDELEDGFSSDLRAANERLRDLERKLATAETEVSQLRRETMLSHGTGLASLKELRADNDTLRSERDRLLLEVADKQHLEEMLREAQSKLREACQDRDNLQVELRAVAGRSAALERRLDETLRRQISQTRTSPGLHHASPATSEVPTGTALAPPTTSSQALRSVSCTNRLSPAPGSGSVKRARTEDARVVAISGFDGTELLMALKKLPSVAVAECQSNVPVPSNLTHLITNGHATIKLLTALVRGCWVLPSRYVMDSMVQRMWLPETEYGFQHEQLPLQKKHVAMTDGFKSLKFHSNADLLLREGGAIFEEDPAEADFVLCSSRELDDVPRGMSWEAFVEMIYPVKLTTEAVQ